ncbi:MAG: hypothetical protein JNL09_07495 [Anaerolineales bacterium]|nr:hypothetical protein [Anaerolineales bacterium]
MQILTVDVGTGTQDIFLYDSNLDLENGYKLVMPSPTMMVNRRLKTATERGERVLLTGYLMGGGPSQWAARDHVRAGGTLFATPSAARTFNDDLEYVQKEMGVRLVSEDEAYALNGEVVRLELKDFDWPLIRRAFAEFGVKLEVDAVAVAVFDHGDAPPGYSDRQFRFDYLDAHVRQANSLAAFAHRAEAVPASMTRLQAVAQAARAQGVEVPLMVMDTAPAAVLGASLDARVAEQMPRGALIANIGNFHCLAFRVSQRGIGGVFEHHTGEVTLEKLDGYLTALANSTLQHRDVFDDMGHGALVYDAELMPAPRFLAVTGPRRSLMSPSALQPYFAVPYGDMMLAGCFGLLAGMAEAYPEFATPIRRSLAGAGGIAPWEFVAK